MKKKFWFGKFSGWGNQEFYPISLEGYIVLLLGVGLEFVIMHYLGNGMNNGIYIKILAFVIILGILFYIAKDRTKRKS